MTEKQIERAQAKIKRIRAALVAEKKKYGGFDDSRGSRYIPPSIYINLEDYTGGLTYFRWFEKNFPDDCGSPIFLFELTLILYKSNKLNRAESYMFKTYCSNIYLFDKFLGNELIHIEKYDSSNYSVIEYLEYFKYVSSSPYLEDFTQWLKLQLQTEKFKSASFEYVEIYKKLKTEEPGEIRRALVKRARQIEEEY